MLCEATRILHSLIEGQAKPGYLISQSNTTENNNSPTPPFKIHKDLSTPTNKNIFIGIDTITEWINVFIGHSIDLRFAVFKEDLQAVRDVNLADLISEMIYTEDVFYETFKAKKINNGTGVEASPEAISRHLTYFHSFMLKEFNKYTELGKRLFGISAFHLEILPESSLDSYTGMLKQINTQFSDLQNHLLDFWNDLIFQSLSHLDKLKLYLGIILCFVLLSVISIIGLAGVFCSANHKGRLGNITGYRGCIFLGLLLMIISIVLFLQYLRVTFTTSYGCSTLLKLQDDDVNFDSSIEGHLHFPLKIQKLFDICLLSNTSSSQSETENSFSPSSAYLGNWLQDDSLKNLLHNFLIFTDSFKAVLEDWDMGAQLTDRSPFDDLITELETASAGTQYQFKSVKSQLDAINNIYACSSYVFKMTDSECKELSTEKKCLSIETDLLKGDQCVQDEPKATAEEIFRNLKESYRQTKALADEMLSRLRGNNDSSAVLYKFSRVWQYITFTQEKLRSINNDLRLNIFGLARGRLLSFLDCGNLKNDIKIIYNNLCNNKLADLLAFADMLSVLLLLELLVLLLLYCLSCWNLEYGRDTFNPKRVKQDKEEIGYYQNKNTKVVLKTKNLNDTYDFMDEESDEDIYYSEPEFGSRNVV
jgi:hypothetical protein